MADFLAKYHAQASQQNQQSDTSFQAPQQSAQGGDFMSKYNNIAQQYNSNQNTPQPEEKPSFFSRMTHFNAGSAFNAAKNTARESIINAVKAYDEISDYTTGGAIQNSLRGKPQAPTLSAREAAPKLANFVMSSANVIPSWLAFNAGTAAAKESENPILVGTAKGIEKVTQTIDKGTGKAVDVLPLDQDIKETIVKPLASLAAQMGAAHFTAKGIGKGIEKGSQVRKGLQPDAVDLAMKRYIATVENDILTKQKNNVPITVNVAKEIASDAVKKVDVKTPGNLSIKTPAGDVKVVSEQSEVFKNLIQGKDKLEYVVDENIPPSFAKFEWDFKTQKGTMHVPNEQVKLHLSKTLKNSTDTPELVRVGENYVFSDKKPETAQVGTQAVKTAETAVQEPTTAASKLVEEARKYKSADEFVKAQPKAFHGTSQQFDNFDDKMLNTSTNTLAGKEGFWFTDSSQEASAYARLSGKRLAKDEAAFNKKSKNLEKQLDEAQNSGNWDLYDDITKKIEEHEATLKTEKPGEFVNEVVLDIKNPKYVDMDGKDSTQGELKKIITQAKKEGNDSVIFKNISDHPEDASIKTTQTVVFDKSAIKTKSQLTDIYNQAQKAPTTPKLKLETDSIGNKIEKNEAGDVVRITGKDGAVKYEADIPVAKAAQETVEAVVKEAAPEVKKMQSRVFSRMQEEVPELKGKTTYEGINLKDDAEKAVELLAKDKNKAYRIAMGAAEPPKGQTSTAVNIAMAEKALDEKNYKLYSQLVKNRSLAQTRRGQEIVAEKGSIKDNSTARWVKELISVRMAKAGDEYLSTLQKLQKKSKKASVSDVIDKEVSKATTKVSAKRMDIKSAQALIDKLAC